MLTSHYMSLGLDSEAAQARVNALSDDEVTEATADIGRAYVGAGEDDEGAKPFRVAITIFIVLAAITGVYFFVNG